MADFINQLTEKFLKKFLILNICHFENLVCIRNSPLQIFWARFPIKKYN